MKTVLLARKMSLTNSLLPSNDFLSRTDTGWCDEEARRFGNCIRYSSHLITPTLEMVILRETDDITFSTFAGLSKTVLRRDI